MTNTRLIHTSAAAALGLAAIFLAIAVGPAAATRTGTHGTSSYGWPVKPFDRQHPVRGGFGDPRTLFSGPPTQRTLLSGRGQFQFHDGVDISAPDGTAVYPVMSGTVASVVPHWPGLTVATPDGRVFEYIHIVTRLRVGTHVDAGVTVLGRILHGCGHVHLTELAAGAPVNPLAAGHLGPYRDTTKPMIRSLTFRAGVGFGQRDARAASRPDRADRRRQRHRQHAGARQLARPAGGACADRSGRSGRPAPGE